ncbi:tetratricopeptide repeat protein [Nocardia asteroides]|uniref:SEL1-like repeat protein n=1 Tax=Nocardia asteroides TaxID=1824 RepID=UPI00343E5597
MSPVAAPTHYSGVHVAGDLNHTTVVGDYYAPPAKADSDLVDLVELHGPDGDLPVVRSLDPYRLKVSRSLFGDSISFGESDPYVARNDRGVDRRVSAALSGDRLVLVTGPSKAGKTRTLFEAVRRELPNAKMVVPDRDSLPELPGCSGYRDHPDTLIVWLENLDVFLAGNRPLTPRLLAALNFRRARTIVVATLRHEKFDELHTDSDLLHGMRTLLDQADHIEMASTKDSPTDHVAAIATYPTLDLTSNGLGEMLAGAPALLTHYRRGRVAGRVTAATAAYTAVVEVVIDWARVGRQDRIPEDRLLEIAREVVNRRYSAYDVTDEHLAAAIVEARQPHVDTGRTTAIDSAWLPSRQIRGYRAFDYLVAADDTNDPRPIPSSFWNQAVARIDLDNLLSVASSAYRRSQPAVSLRLFRHAAEAGHPGAMSAYGYLLGDLGKVDEATRWYRRSADLGDLDGMNSLALGLKDAGRIPEAEGWWRRAAAAGHPGAMNNLGFLASLRGEDAESEQWWQRAAGYLHPGAMFNYGKFLKDKGALEQAEVWWRRAADLRHAGAMNNLSLLMKARGELAGAEDLLRRAAALGHTDAIGNLGVLLADRGEFVEAETCYRQVAAAGDLSVLNRLGLLFKRQGRIGEASECWERAADAGNVDAMMNHAVLLRELGKPSESALWWQRAAEAGSSAAMFATGHALEQRGELNGAESWYRRGAAAGSADAMNNLAVLLIGKGELGEAEIWLQQAADAGDAGAGRNLELLRRQQNR